MNWGTEVQVQVRGEGDKLHLGHSKLKVPGGHPGADVRRHIWVFMGLRLMEEGR